jgi:hypothetical protein
LAVASQPHIVLFIPPQSLRHSDFMKSLTISMKSLRGFGNFQEGLLWQGLDENANIIKRWRRGNRRRWWWIREISMQRLPSPISQLKWRMISERVSWNPLRPMKCWLKWFTALFRKICSSHRSRPGGWRKCFLRRWRKERVIVCEAIIVMIAATC